VDDTAFAGIVSKSLALLEAGESIEGIVARYPEVSPRLRELLETACDLRNRDIATVQPSPGFLRQLGQRLMRT
jgi:hypothetical protein